MIEIPARGTLMAKSQPWFLVSESVYKTAYRLTL